jgi:glycosyltransferase involved in cell wall biosynthesis
LAPSTTASLFMRPAWRCTNPYTALLAEAVQEAGASVSELGYAARDLPRERAVLLFHWPDEFFATAPPVQMGKALHRLKRLAQYKRRYGQRLIWLAHNVVPHRPHRPFTMARTRFFNLLDGLIFLSEASRTEVFARYPELATKPHLIVAHGDYHRLEQTPPSPAPPLAGRPVRLSLAGRIQRYKAADRLAALVANRPAEDVELAIAGACDDPALAADLMRIAETSPNISVRLGRLEQAALEAQIDAADAAVLPYRAILNSGSALMSLSRGRPVIAPRMGSLPELQRQVGEDWLWLYDGEFDAGLLARAIVWLKARRPAAGPDLSEHDWARIGASVSGFVQQIARSA